MRKQIPNAERTYLAVPCAERHAEKKPGTWDWEQSYISTSL
jgi:hypothetical protein